MAGLKVFEVINGKNRISSLDIFRGIATIGVITNHFNNSMPLGYLGLDLFFVISGLLIGGILTTELQTENKINYPKFLLQRAFKILPSYYFFLIAGTLVAIFLYRKSNPEEIIHLWDVKRYIFFYSNIVYLPRHWSFGHLWSLSIEEQFYIALPIMFLAVRYFVKDKYRLTALFLFIILTIICIIFFNYFWYCQCVSKNISYSAKYNRDSLAWGVLLNLIIVRYGERMKSIKFKACSFSAGIILFIVSCLAVYYKCVVFRAVFFHTFIPVSFFLMIAGLYFVKFPQWTFLRVIAYYSYNWYLWHRVFIIYITQYFGNTIMGITVYLVVTFIVAVLTTIFVEETFLKKRKIVIGKLFKK